MDKLTLKMKLWVGFGTLLTILLFSAFAGLRTINSLNEAAHQVERKIQEKELTLSLIGSVLQETSGTRVFLATGEEQALERVSEGHAEYVRVSEKLARLLLSEKAKGLYAEMGHTHDAFRTVIDRETQLKRGGRSKEAQSLALTQQVQALRAVEKANADFVGYLTEGEDAGRQEQDAEVRRSKVVLVVMSIVGLLIGAVVATLITRSIIGLLGLMLTFIRQVAGNNLTVEDLQTHSHDEIGEASWALNEMKGNLRGIMQSMASHAERLASAGEEISSTAMQGARGAERQKDEVSQVATAMQEMSATVREVSQNSIKAAESAHAAAETAREGGAIVEDTLTRMRSIADAVRETAAKVQELGTRSDQIGRIIGVIDEIADQTNLLALNAAIEAARAGEQGRGFAVVADEVRKLAERTAKATKEIAQMIQGIQAETKAAVEKMKSGMEQVEKGVAATGKAGESLNQIILAAEGVGDTVSQIAIAASEQSNATEQVNSSMDQINNLAAESAEGARQSAQACQQLSGLALDLKKTVEKFEIGPRRMADENGTVWMDREGAPAPRAFAAAASANSDRHSGA